MGLSGLLRFDVALQSFPNFSTPSGVSEVSGNAGVFQEIVRNAVEILTGNAEVRHTTGRANGMRTLEECAEAFVRVFFGEVSKRDRGLAEEFLAIGIARRVAGHAADGMKEFVSFASGDGIGSFLLELGALVERDEVVGDLGRDGFLFLRAQGIRETRHGGAGFDRVRGGDKVLEIVGIHASSDRG